MNLTIGQTVYVKPINNAARSGFRKVEEATVSKIGRKWFYLKEMAEERHRFDLVTGYKDGRGYSSNYKVYSSMEEILLEKEARELQDFLRITFSAFPKLSLPAMRKIKEIVEQDGKDNI